MRLVISIFFIAVFAASAHAQSFEAGVHVAISQWSEFKGADSGLGGRIGWKPLPLMSIEADLTWYPSDFAPAVVPFSRQRVEGLFGATIGPQLNRVRPFAKATAGFLNVSPTSGAFACIAIFPPPLACLLAGGQTMAAYELGGGVSIDATPKTFIRVDVTDRILKYPGPTFRNGLSERSDDGFLGHAVRLTLGGGIRF